MYKGNQNFDPQHITELDFNLKMHRLETYVIPKEKEVKQIEKQLTNLCNFHIKTQDQVLHLINQIRSTIKQAEKVLLDVKGTFIDLGMWGIYDIFSGLFYSMLIAVGVLADTCARGVQQNIIHYGVGLNKKNQKEDSITVCITQKENEKNNHQNAYLQKWSQAQIEREINKMYSQVFIERQAIKKITPSGITRSLQEMGLYFDSMIEESELILEQAYLRNHRTNADKSNEKCSDSQYVNKVFKGELLGLLRGQISTRMQKILRKLYSDFYKKEKQDIVKRMLDEKPSTQNSYQQTDIDGLNKVKQMYKERKNHQKTQKELSDIKKQLERMTQQYLQANRKNEIDCIKISELEKIIQEEQDKQKRKISQRRQSNLNLQKKSSLEKTSNYQDNLRQSTKKMTIMGLQYSQTNEVQKDLDKIVVSTLSRRQSSINVLNKSNKRQKKRMSNMNLNKQNHKVIVDRKKFSIQSHQNPHIKLNAQGEGEKNNEIEQNLMGENRVQENKMEISLEIGRKQDRKGNAIRQKMKNLNVKNKQNKEYLQKNQISNQLDGNFLNQSKIMGKSLMNRSFQQQKNTPNRHQVNRFRSQQNQMESLNFDMKKLNPLKLSKFYSLKQEKTVQHNKTSDINNNLCTQNSQDLCDQVASNSSSEMVSMVKNQTDQQSKKTIQQEQKTINLHFKKQISVEKQNKDNKNAQIQSNKLSNYEKINEQGKIRQISEIEEQSENFEIPKNNTPTKLQKKVSRFSLGEKQKKRTTNLSCGIQKRCLLTEGKESMIHTLGETIGETNAYFENLGIKFNFQGQQNIKKNSIIGSKMIRVPASRQSKTKVVNGKSSFNNTFTFFNQKEQGRLISFIPIERIQKINNIYAKYEVFGRQIANIVKMDPNNVQENIRKYAPTAAKILLGRIPLSEVDQLNNRQEQKKKRLFSTVRS